MSPYGYPDEQTWWPAFAIEVAALYREAGRDVDPTAFWWYTRTAFDCGAGLSVEASHEKHLNELRAALGLTRPAPPAPSPAPVPTPPANVTSFDVPAGYDLDEPARLVAFIALGLRLAYGPSADASYVGYWIEHADEMRARGIALQMNPTERYFWERIIGRGSGGDNVARNGPYAGLVECQASLSAGS